jgi:hypothetical protein
MKVEVPLFYFNVSENGGFLKEVLKRAANTHHIGERGCFSLFFSFFSP